MTPPRSFPSHNDAETLFDRLDAAGLTWRVYCDPPSHYSLTGIIHAPRLADRFATNFFSTRQFFEDAETGSLPTYSFIEPQIIGWNHNDMHPPFGGVIGALGEQLGAEDAATCSPRPRSSPARTCSQHLRRDPQLLLADRLQPPQHDTAGDLDEHGGTYDHVPPPPAVPPAGTGAVGAVRFHVQAARACGLRRSRSRRGSRSEPSSTTCTTTRRLIRTMRERWDLGNPAHRARAAVSDIGPVLTRDEPRGPDEWPDVDPQPVPEFDESLIPLDAPLSPLAKAFIGEGKRSHSPASSINPCLRSQTLKISRAGRR